MKLRVEVKLPRYGTTMEEATIGNWLKAIGDWVEQGDPLCEIETEKVAAEFESPVSGTLVEIVAASGDNAEVGTVICRLENEVGG
jgi:pyruvate/2-oxoglutarate dehydrogenase complex dihydrolipoamide acyltransferase (E2) component